MAILFQRIKRRAAFLFNNVEQVGSAAIKSLARAISN